VTPGKFIAAIAGGVAASFLTVWLGHAEVVGDGTYVAIGTNGESTEAMLVSVSNGGSADAYGTPLLCPGPFICPKDGGVSVTTTNGSATTADGAAVSVGGCTSGMVAISATGCTSGPSWNRSGVLSVSGTGATNYTEIGVTATGSASADTVAVSATGPAYACGGPVNASVSAAGALGGPPPQSCPYTVPVPVSVHQSFLSSN
jgi:hypothetical protein